MPVTEWDFHCSQDYPHGAGAWHSVPAVGGTEFAVLVGLDSIQVTPAWRSPTELRDAPTMTSAVHAAVEVAEKFGITSSDPVLLQETNNTVVWLQPEPVVAKVAVRVHSREEVRLEHAVALELEALGSDAVRPLPGTQPTSHSNTGFVVTLWQRLEGLDRVTVPPEQLARSLRNLHEMLGHTQVDLPSFRTMIVKANRALEDHSFIVDLPSADHDLLRASFERGFAAIQGASFEDIRLHGEPHDGNRILTKEGLRWIDFESSCIGPLEWDLAFQSDEVVRRFPEADLGLLELLRTLNSARVATWCLGSPSPEMKQHGELHLTLLRQTAVDP